MSNLRNEAAKKAWVTRHSAPYKAAKSEKRSKKALEVWCRSNGWKLVFFEGETGAPRTGIVDGIMVRIRPREADVVEIKFVQLKSGGSGLTGKEIERLKKATGQVSMNWLLAAFDGKTLHFLPEIPAPSK